MTAAAAPVKSRRSWRKLAVGVGAFILAPLLPQFRAILPIEQTPLMLIVVVAACAIVGWIKGGRFALPLIWVVIAAVLGLLDSRQLNCHVDRRRPQRFPEVAASPIRV